MAHKKAGGSSRNGRDSGGQRLGIKIFGGEEVARRQHDRAPARHQMACRPQCRRRQGPHVVCVDRRPNPVPYQSQRPRLRVGTSDDGGCGPVKRWIIIEVRRHPVEPAGPNGLRKGGDRDAGSPFRFYLARSPCHDAVWKRSRDETTRERSIPVLETERLTLRAPRLEDVKAIALIANDRRIAENTARIPHPYSVDDARAFIAAVNRGDGRGRVRRHARRHRDRRLRHRSARGAVRSSAIGSAWPIGAMDMPPRRCAR